MSRSRSTASRSSFPRTFVTAALVASAAFCAIRFAFSRKERGGGGAGEPEEEGGLGGLGGLGVGGGGGATDDDIPEEPGGGAVWGDVDVEEGRGASLVVAWWWL